MTTYIIARTPATATGQAADLLRVGFGQPAQNDQIVRDAERGLSALGEMGGRLALINGPASLPVAVVLAHHLLHRYGAVGVFDPKLAAYVVAAAHGGNYTVGDLIPAADVVEA